MFRFRRRRRYSHFRFEAIARLSSSIIGYAIRDGVSEIRIVPNGMSCNVMYLRQNEWATQMHIPDAFGELNEFYRKSINDKNVLEFFLEDQAMKLAFMIKVQLTWTDNAVIKLKIGAPSFHRCDDEHYIEYSKLRNISWTKE